MSRQLMKAHHLIALNAQLRRVWLILYECDRRVIPEVCHGSAGLVSGRRLRRQTLLCERGTYPRSGIHGQQTRSRLSGRPQPRP